MEWYLAVLKKYAEFSGRSRRKEYWMYTLFTIIISVGLSVADEMAGLNKATGGLSPLSTLYGLAVLIPGLAVTIRRLHDIGKSGWWLLIIFVPLAGGIILLLFMIREGDRGNNEFGRDPKGRAGDDRDDRGEKRYGDYDEE